ncbi:hypothetical protein LOC71_03280 [Rhodopirellula sp. JC740]|uniref:Carboxypeptidase regulatory-like domain-containing protein n=1 Tax=Rhodopirellula halodulae TaxID=2894198 RepID=A0ABS8NCM0_9BACT|nr:hypothetical protein [Rhodopirellula sp. JC740]MCC9641283.1 hypothetical protein [Rhodopirellula sp. JC740]
MKQQLQHLCFLSLVGISALTAGCSGSDKPALAPVEGTLTKDGVPFVNATLEFHPQTHGGVSYGQTDETGQFKLHYTTGEPGAAIGKHEVLVFGGHEKGKTSASSSALAGNPDEGDAPTLIGDPDAGKKKRSGRGGAPAGPVKIMADVGDSDNQLSLTIPS